MQIYICICFNQFSLSFVVWYLIFQKHRKDTTDTKYVTFAYCMSKKSCPFLFCDSLCEESLDFLDVQYTSKEYVKNCKLFRLHGYGKKFLNRLIRYRVDQL